MASKRFTPREGEEYTKYDLEEEKDVPLRPLMKMWLKAIGVIVVIILGMTSNALWEVAKAVLDKLKS